MCAYKGTVKSHSSLQTWNSSALHIIFTKTREVPSLFLQASVLLVCICQVSFGLPQLVLQQGNALCGSSHLAAFLLTLLLYCTHCMSMKSKPRGCLQPVEAWLQLCVMQLHAYTVLRVSIMAVLPSGKAAHLPFHHAWPETSLGERRESYSLS